MMQSCREQLAEQNIKALFIKSYRKPCRGLRMVHVVQTTLTDTRVIMIVSTDYGKK